jgi:hypothetical protein
MCSKTGWLAFEQMHLAQEISQRKLGCVKGA